MSVWYIAQTKPRQEVGLQIILLHLGVEEVFLPLIAVHRRRKKVLEPLFPNYIFCRFNMETVNWPAIRWAQGIHHFLEVDGDPSFVPDELVEYIRQRVERWNSRGSSSQNLSPGQSVKITGGPFAGIEGVFERNMRPSGRTQILLEVFERLVRTEIDKTDIAEKFPGL